MLRKIETNWQIGGRAVEQQGRIKQSCPCALTEHHAMKAFGGVEVLLHTF
jgi:hypothetical protein